MSARVVVFGVVSVMAAVGGTVLIHRANHAAAAGPSATQPSPQQSGPASGTARLRYDGLYRASDKGTEFSFYLRFYPDGTVIRVYSSGEPEDLMKWFSKDTSDLESGRIILNGNHLSFTLVAPEPTVDCDGEILADQIRLNSHSRINGHRGSVTYVFAVPEELVIRKEAEQAGALLIRMAEQQGDAAARKMATDTVAADQSEVDRLAKVVVPEIKVTVADGPNQFVPAHGTAIGDGTPGFIVGARLHEESVPEPKAMAEVRAARKSAATKLAADKLAAEMLWEKIGRGPIAAED